MKHSVAVTAHGMLRTAADCQYGLRLKVASWMVRTCAILFNSAVAAFRCRSMQFLALEFGHQKHGCECIQYIDGGQQCNRHLE